MTSYHCCLLLCALLSPVQGMAEEAAADSAAAPGGGAPEVSQGELAYTAWAVANLGWADVQQGVMEEEVLAMTQEAAADGGGASPEVPQGGAPVDGALSEGSSPEELTWEDEAPGVSPYGGLPNELTPEDEVPGEELVMTQEDEVPAEVLAMAPETAADGDIDSPEASQGGASVDGDMRKRLEDGVTWDAVRQEMEKLLEDASRATKESKDPDDIAMAEEVLADGDSPELSQSGVSFDGNSGDLLQQFEDGETAQPAEPAEVSAMTQEVMVDGVDGDSPEASQGSLLLDADAPPSDAPQKMEDGASAPEQPEATVTQDAAVDGETLPGNVSSDSNSPKKLDPAAILAAIASEVEGLSLDANSPKRSADGMSIEDIAIDNIVRKHLGMPKRGPREQMIKVGESQQDEETQILMVSDRMQDDTIQPPTVHLLNRFTFHGNVVAPGNNHVEHWLVRFCYPWFMPCGATEKAFQDIAEEVQGTYNSGFSLTTFVRFAEVDCSVDKPLCKEMGANHFPSVIHYHRHEQVGAWHGGDPERDARRLAKWVVKQLPALEPGEMSAPQLSPSPSSQIKPSRVTSHTQCANAQGGQKGSNMLDGNMKTIWNPMCPQFHNHWSIVFDLGEKRLVTGIQLASVGDTTHDPEEVNIRGCPTGTPSSFQVCPVLHTCHFTAGKPDYQECIFKRVRNVQFMLVEVTKTSSGWQPYLSEILVDVEPPSRSVLRSLYQQAVELIDDWMMSFHSGTLLKGQNAEYVMEVGVGLILITAIAGNFWFMSLGRSPEAKGSVDALAVGHPGVPCPSLSPGQDTAMPARGQAERSAGALVRRSSGNQLVPDEWITLAPSEIEL